MNDPDANARNALLRQLPAVDAVIATARMEQLQQRHGHRLVVRIVREAIEQARDRILAGERGRVDETELAEQIEKAARPSLRPVENAAGVVVHTNLGRAPLATAAIDAMVQVARGYSSLEYDLEIGGRGNRHGHALGMLCELTGAEDAAVVNNNAGALLLILTALAERRAVVVSRGELVEIGGGFPIPDVMLQSGARLLEVGTTNRTRLADYAAVDDPELAILLKVHRSNFAVVGFTEEASLAELVGLGRERGLPVVYDAGSGCLLRQPELGDEPAIDEIVRLGVDLVCFSGDKLLGGPQAGLIVGRHALISTLRHHPLMRVLRPDKLCLAALVASLRLWRDHPESIPVRAMIACTEQELEQRAEAMAAELREVRGDLDLSVRPCVDRVGGGASPLTELAGSALRIDGADAPALDARLRAGEPPVVARIEDDALWVHPRTLQPERDRVVVQALLTALGDADNRTG